MFKWKTHPDPAYVKVSIVCKEGYQVTKTHVYREGEKVIAYDAWPPSPARPPKSGFYKWEDHCQEYIGLYEKPEQAKKACWDHYQEKLNVKTATIPG